MVKSTDLAHYGVIGMKWGVRKYQDKSGRLTAAGRERYSSNLASDNNSQGNSARKLVESNANKRASDLVGSGEEYAVMAATYAAAIGVMFGAAKIAEKLGRKKKANELEELNDNKEIKSFDEAPKLSKKMSPEQSVKLTNPDYPDLGTTMNCTFCTTAMVLREKGYDVKAAKLNDGTYSDDLFKKTFNSTETKLKAKNTKQLLDKLGSNGDGAYGNLVVSWKYGGAHSIFWKNENGTTNFYDGQSGTAYTKFNDKKLLFGYTQLSQTKYNRLDNCEPTEYALATVERAKK